jgi:hypothetical protein
MYGSNLKIVNDFKWSRILLDGVPIFKVSKSDPDHTRKIKNFIKEKRL